MILGLGMDVVETARVDRALANHGERFAERVYTPAELADCAARPNRVQALAARFAAKEAFLKALGTGSVLELLLQEIEVVTRDGGQPELRLGGSAAARVSDRGVQRVHLSLTHDGDVAAAVVIFEG